MQARQEFTVAEHSQAARYNPAALHDAKTALDRAESLYKDDADKNLVSDAAYVAMRRAERAKIEGETLALQTRKEQLVRNEQQAQAKSVQQTQSELEQTRMELDKERAAREQAEKHASDAMSKLQQEGAVQERPSGTVITMSGGVLFQSGQSDLMPGSEKNLDKVADALRQVGERKIVVRGYTDSTGKKQTNLMLSKARAEAVANYLASRGVSQDKITTEGLGDADPVSPNKTAAGRAANRRVEVEVRRPQSGG